MSFEVTLPRAPVAKIWASEGPDISPLAKKLQDLFDRGQSDQYDLELSAMSATGAKFRLTDGKVFEIKDSDRCIKTPIKFQVKGGTITWYILAPKDETHQSFRDEVYGAAGLGHLNVTNHCEKYWRGTNSLHIKLMHTNEDEASFNHNHYRMKDGDADPVAVYEHLMGFVQAERELELFDAEGKEKFLDATEAEEVYKKFQQHWIETRHVGPATTLELDGKKISLPAREVSLIDTFRSLPGQALTPEDIAEWEANKSKQDPCVSIDNWDSMNVKERLTAIAAGMRGLGAELAQTRQMEGSKYATHITVVAKDDAVVIA